MLGQLEVGFVLRVALGFILLVGVSYVSYVYIENAEKTKMNQFLSVVGEYIARDITGTISEIEENTTVYKKSYIPPAGDPFGGNYYVTLEKTSDNVYLVVNAYRWRDVGVKIPLYLNPDNVNVSGTLAPTMLCVNVTRTSQGYDIALRC